MSEILGVGTDDVDLARGTLTITHLKSRISVSCKNCGEKLGLRHDFCPKCGSKNELNFTALSEKRKQRLLPLDASTAALIKQFIEENGLVSHDGKNRLFGITRHRAWQIIKQCAEKAGLTELVNPETGRKRGVSPHRLRDAFAVHAMKVNDSGEGMRLLQEHLGRASFNTTAKYRKIASEEHKSWFEKLWQ